MRKKETNAAVFFQAYAEKLLSAGREEDGARLMEAARNVWRDLLRSRGLDAFDAEIERVMVLAGEVNPPPGRAPWDIEVDLEFQKEERAQRPAASRPE